jgi:hypothetical protein
LKGANFYGIAAVSFGSSPAASYTVIDTATIVAVVGAGASGAMSVSNPKGTATAPAPAFFFTTVPVITSFTPAAGSNGTPITITGANFSADTAANIVFLGSVRAPVTAATANTLVVTAPAGTIYQPITVNSNGLIASANNSFVKTFPGAGPAFSANSFDGVKLFTVDSMPAGIVICDFDGDGKPDLAAGSPYGVSVLRNTSSNGFLSFAPKLSLPGIYMPQFLAAGDVDGDGKPDLVVADGSSSGSLVSIYKNTSTPGTVSFKLVSQISISGSNKILLYDIDGDGKSDIISLNYSRLIIFQYCEIRPREGLSRLTTR